MFHFYCHDVYLWAFSCAVALYLFLKMFLQTLWRRLGTQLLAKRKPVFTRIYQSLQPHKYKCQPRTYWIHAKISLITRHHQKNQNVGHFLAASGGLTCFTRTSLDSGVVTCTWGPKRLYSTNPVNLMLKPNLKTAVVPGKKVPKGPRTKQPSRTNQPSLKEDKVADQATPQDVLMTTSSFLDENSNLLLSLGYDAMYRFCNSRSVSLTNTLL